MKTRARPVCVIGNANLDLVAGSVADWPAWGTEVFLSNSDFRIGGSAANTASVLHRLGHETGLISARGEDEPGEMIGRHFSGALDRVAVLSERTSISVGILQTGGERSFFSTDGHLDGLDVKFFREMLKDWPLDGALALVSGGFALPALMDEHTDFLRWLRAQGTEIAIDPGWPGEGWTETAIRLAREWIAVADHLLFNDLEACGLTGTTDIGQALATMQGMLAPSARLIVKRGAEGASCSCDGELVREPAKSLEIMDTIGAGDAFNAGYLSAVADGESARVALRRGIHVAGHVISEFPRRSDPIPPIP
jgi:sugar/nucleoside kinase (ribokinase family)